MFLQRLFSSVVILVIFFSIVFLKETTGLVLFILVGVFVSAAATREMSLILHNLGINKFLYVNEIFAVLVFLFTSICDVESDISVLLLVAMIIALWAKILFSINKRDEILKVLNFVFVFVLLIVPMNFVALIFMEDYGVNYLGLKLMVFLILVTKFGDIGAYVVGTLTSKRKGGNYKIAPAISPKKSWEGTMGGLIVSVAVSMSISHIYNLFTMQMAAVFGIGLFIGGFVGDLAESSLKRCAKIKDSGNTIPGIGGVLDLVDSLLINAPLFYALLLYCNIIN